MRQGRRWNPWGDLVWLRFYVAVDDGTGDSVYGLLVSKERFYAREPGDHVHVVLTPRLRHVRLMEPAPSRSG